MRGILASPARGRDHGCVESQSVRIAAPVARALVHIRALNTGQEHAVPVKDAMAAAKALADPENEHCCPLCNEFFPTLAFVAHARQCIEARMPRRKVWAPPHTPGALAVFPEKTNYLEIDKA